MSKWRKKPVVVEAFKWTGGPDQTEDPEWFSMALNFRQARHEIMSIHGSACIVLETLEGEMRASPGDYIIRGITGEIYPCKPDAFAATYEPVEV